MTLPCIKLCDACSFPRISSTDGTAPAVARLHPRARIVRLDPTSAMMAASPFPNTLGVRGSELLGLLAGACMVRRAALLDIGGYHPRLFLGREEAVLAIDLMTAGWHMAYVPDAVVCHFPSRMRDTAGGRE